MKLNATDLSLIQRGDRLFSISRTYRYLPWRPTSLFSHIMREAITTLSNTADLTTASNLAVEAFLRAAMQPGLDVARGTDTYKLSQDFCATMRTILEALSRRALLSLSKPKPILLNADTWEFINYADDTGTLHRYVFLDAIDENSLYHHARSWETFADQAILNAPLYLHLIAIGSTHNSRRVSPWCRIFSSPSIANVFRFKRKEGELRGDWKPVWYADSNKNKPSTWVDLMDHDSILPSLMHTRLLHPPSDSVRARFLSSELPQLTDRIASALVPDPFTLPMCRTSCDTPYPCPHEHACYSPHPSVSVLTNSGLYSKLPARSLG